MSVWGWTIGTRLQEVTNEQRCAVKDVLRFTKQKHLIRKYTNRASHGLSLNLEDALGVKACSSVHIGKHKSVRDASERSITANPA